MLQLRWQPDTDGTGELFVYVQRGRYSGEGSAWFHDRELEDFGARLRDTFPLIPGSTLSLQGGHWKSGSSPPVLEDVLVGISVYPVGPNGAIGVKVDVMDGYHERQRQESRAQLTLELLTDYEPLRELGNGILQLLRSPGATATLPGYGQAFGSGEEDAGLTGDDD
ncbi:MAG TPA: hypothetical protein VEZ89_06445 [Rubrivivax sp.]|nr:hypothetical protein [Rubrivivax sp.]